MQQRAIKSFVIRAGRISERQQQGLDSWFSAYQLPQDGQVWDLEKHFGRAADTVVEIGFGMGASLLAMAQAQPETNFIGIEVHRAGIGSLSADLHEAQVNNVRIAAHDAVEVFKANLAVQSLAGVQIFFPDPWPKKRHHKRRLIQPEFIQLVVERLQPGGFLHCATDWQNYAEQMVEVLSSHPELVNQNKQGGFLPRPPTRPLTKFEQRGQRLGHGVWDLVFTRQAIWG